MTPTSYEQVRLVGNLTSEVEILYFCTTTDQARGKSPISYHTGEHMPIAQQSHNSHVSNRTQLYHSDRLATA